MTYAPETQRRVRWTAEDGQWLRKEREKRELTQKDLGGVIQRTAGRISELERGYTSSGPTAPSPEQLQAFKDFFARTPAVVEGESSHGSRTRLTLEIDGELMREALEVSSAGTKTGVIEQALREFVRSQRIEQLRKMIGTYEIDLTPEDLRRMRGKVDVRVGDPPSRYSVSARATGRRHTWTWDDDVVAFYLYKCEGGSQITNIPFSVSQIVAKLGMPANSLRRRIENFEFLETGKPKGASHYAAQSEAVYVKHKDDSCEDLRSETMRILSG